MAHAFQTQFIDLLAMRVKNIERSANLYDEVLGLKMYQLSDWGGVSMVALARKAGVAIFPVNLNHPAIGETSKGVSIDHFAFNIDLMNFIKPSDFYRENGIEFEFQDHQYFYSLYLNDPDGRQAELTVLVLMKILFLRNS